MTENSEEATETDEEGKLSLKRQRFCEFMLVCSSATKAAIAANYSEKSAHVTACRLLKNANVQAEISRLRQIAAEKADIKPEQVIYGIQHDLDLARQAKHWTAVMAGHKMLGQYLSMWKDGLEVIKPASEIEHHRSFAAFALAGAKGNRPLARQIFRGFLRETGSADVFDGGEATFTDGDIDALLDGATQH